MSNISVENRNSILIFFLTTVSTYLLIKGWRRLRDSHRLGVLRLIIYPIKSVPGEVIRVFYISRIFLLFEGIEVDQLEITLTGVKYQGVHDRTFMLLNESNNLVSLRTKPTLALISPSLDGDTISLEALGMEQLKLSTSKDCSGNQVVEFRLWGQNIKGD